MIFYHQYTITLLFFLNIYYLKNYQAKNKYMQKILLFEKYKILNI